MLNVPFLFLVFNRPDITRKVFAAIRQAKPKQLYVAADGARVTKPSDKTNCREVRKIVKALDWDCEVQYLFQEKNLGCKNRVSTGIDWFFDNIERGMVLEDDCLPDPSFFPVKSY